MIPYRPINLLCPGPSLREAKPDFKLCTIAINCAVEFGPCHWWAVGDDVPVKHSKTLPSVGIGSKQSVINDIRNGKVRPKCDWNDELLLLSFNHYPDYGKPWYTSWYALHMAKSLGAKEIIIYGMDLMGEGYFMNAAYDGKFMENRWTGEKRKLDELFDLFQNRFGITITLNPHKTHGT